MPSELIFLIAFQSHLFCEHQQLALILLLALAYRSG